VPTVGGELAFDSSYDGNPLVNVFALGIVEADRVFLGRADGVGNPVIYVGAKTGRDGIHGATMASAQFDEGTEAKRPTVQVGDPFTEKLLLEACLELFRSDAVVGIQDMGAAGLTSSSVEMASRAGSGLDLDLDKVPRREQGMTPYELMLSESQERMLIVAKRGREIEVEAIFEKWDLDAAVIGTVTDSGNLRLFERGEIVADLPIGPLAENAPLYDRPRAAPAHREPAPRRSGQRAPEPAVALLGLLGRPSIGSKEWVHRQYDSMVGIGTVIGPGRGDAAVIRVGERKGLAMSVDCNPRFCLLNPYEGARLAVAEAARNVSCAGGEPIGLTDCLNFGNPEKPEVMWQLTEAIRGIGDACRALGIPVVSGNVSLYNDTEGESIKPTPTVAMVGLIPDVERAVPAGFAGAGRTVALLGSLRGELSGSEHSLAFYGEIEGEPPAIDLELEAAVQRCVRELVRSGIVESAHDCSEGGLAVALAKCCLLARPAPVGARIWVESALEPEPLLFGEEPSRVIVSFPPGRRAEVEACAARVGVPLMLIGETGGSELGVEGIFRVSIAGLEAAWRGSLREVIGTRAKGAAKGTKG
jgi:phosphoribosylformylglycinamidine synthase